MRGGNISADEQKDHLSVFIWTITDMRSSEGLGGSALLPLRDGISSLAAAKVSIAFWGQAGSIRFVPTWGDILHLF